MGDMTRRHFVKMAGTMVAGVGLTGIGGLVSGCGQAQTTGGTAMAKVTEGRKEEVVGKSKVYFTRQIDVEHLTLWYSPWMRSSGGKEKLGHHVLMPRNGWKGIRRNFQNHLS